MLKPFAVAALLAAFATAGCYHPPPPSSAQLAIRNDCRETADRQYLAQNRAELTRRDDRDIAFSSSYQAGVTTRGLGAEYAREQEIDSCLRRGNAAGDQTARPGIGATFSPDTPLPGLPRP